MKMRWSLPLLVVLLAASACSPGGAATPDEARVAASAAAAAVPAPSATPGPDLTPEASIPPPGGVGGQEAILILEPGPQSGITSPVHVAGLADPTFEQNLVVQITDADGVLLALVPTTIQADLGQRGPFAADVTFGVTGEQPGRMSVFSTSARDGGLIHLASVEVTLLAGGPASINPAAPHKESIGLLEPALLAEVNGGVAHLAGFSDYVFENQLGVVICGAGGQGAPDLLCGTEDNVLATGGAYVNSPDLGRPGPLSGDVAYLVAGRQRARIVIYDASPRDGGYTHANSVEVTLLP
jgi:hypothetical protein